MEELDLRAPRLVPPASLEPVFSTDPYDRAAHTYGRSFRDLVRAFRRDYAHAPDLVAFPRGEDELVSVLDWCGDAGVAAIPFGGGSSVVGGVEPDVGDGYRGVISVDLRHLQGVLEVDRTSRAARIAAGTLGPALEAQLKPHGLTLRHFPQSFEWSTLGGWIATRSGGHFATLHTHIDEFVEAVRVVTPRGVLQTRRLPASGAGPSPERLFCGSEGTLGVITEAWMRVQPRPRFRAGASVLFADFADAVQASRELAQSGRPDCASSRDACTASAKSAKSTEAPARNRGRGCTRIHASVITPSVPSEPQNSRSGDGPAPSRAAAGSAARRAASPRGRTPRTRRYGCAASRSDRPSASRSTRPASTTRTTAGNAASVRPCGFSCASSAGPSVPACDPRGPRGTVDLQHPRQVAKVDADHAAIAVPDIGLDPADHAGAAAERDRRYAGVAAPVQHRDQLVLTAGERHEIRRMRVVPAQGPHQIAERPAVGVDGPVVRVRAEDRLEPRRRHQPRRTQVQLLYSRWRLHAHAIDPQAFGEDGPELPDLTLRQPFAFQAPAPELAPRGWLLQRRRGPVARSVSAHYHPS